jgi:hypothetical protein
MMMWPPIGLDSAGYVLRRRPSALLRGALKVSGYGNQSRVEADKAQSPVMCRGRRFNPGFLLAGFSRFVLSPLAWTDRSHLRQ